MRKINYLLLGLSTFLLTGCFLLEPPGRNPSTSEDVSTGSLGSIVSPDDYSYQSNFATYRDLEKKGIYRNHYCPSTGDVNILVVPFAFSNSPTSVVNNSTISSIKTAFNGSDSETGWKSLSTYFNECSYGALNVTATVADEWYVSSHNEAYYGNDNDYCDYTVQAVEDVCEWYSNKYNDDLTKFDQDKDGFIDTVVLIYAAHNYVTARSSYDNFWAYTYWADKDGSGSVSKPQPDTFIWASYDFMFSSNGQGSSYIDIDAHTYIHEFGHCLGLDDYYNYDTDSDEGPAGGFEMQDCNVGDHNPFSKMALGWAKPYIVNGEGSITLSVSSTNKNQYLMIPAGGFDKWNKSPFDEYLIIELYAPKGLNEFDSTHETYRGYPQGPKVSGIRLYHVDARVYPFAKNTSRVTPVTSVGYVDSISNNSYSYAVAASNSTSGAGEGYKTYIPEATDYRLVHLISSTKVDRMKAGYTLSKNDLFEANDQFKMADYYRMFAHQGYMNEKENGSYTEKLGYGFKVTSLTSTTATIEIFIDNN